MRESPEKIESEPTRHGLLYAVLGGLSVAFICALLHSSGCSSQFDNVFTYLGIGHSAKVEHKKHEIQREEEARAKAEEESADRELKRKLREAQALAEIEAAKEAEIKARLRSLEEEHLARLRKLELDTALRKADREAKAAEEAYQHEERKRKLVTAFEEQTRQAEEKRFQQRASLFANSIMVDGYWVVPNAELVGLTPEHIGSKLRLSVVVGELPPLYGNGLASFTGGGGLRFQASKDCVPTSLWKDLTVNGRIPAGAKLVLNATVTHVRGNSVAIQIDTWGR